MTTKPLATLRRAALATAPLALALCLSACGNDNDSPSSIATPTPTPTTTPSPSPSPSPTPTAAGRVVTACLNQAIPGTSNAAAGGAAFTPASLVVPDTLKLNFDGPQGFPNGRRLTDPVIDVTLAVLLLDLTRHSPGLLAGIPLNPPNDNPTVTTTFPFFGPANGGQPAAGTGTAFNFRTDPASAYVRVDRMGQPAVATALVGTSLKNAYNDANPSDDIAGTFVPEFVNQLTLLHNGLADDLIAAGLTPCSTPG